MTEINYNNRFFKMVDSSTGDEEAVASTIFHYRQKGDVVWGTYEGGSVAFGTLVGKLVDKGNLDLRFQHIYTNGDMMAGKCCTTLHILDDGRYRLDEAFRVFNEEEDSSGHSIVEEFFPG